MLSDIPAGDGNDANLFYSVYSIKIIPRIRHFDFIKQYVTCGVKLGKANLNCVFAVERRTPE